MAIRYPLVVGAALAVAAAASATALLARREGVRAPERGPTRLAEKAPPLTEEQESAPLPIPKKLALKQRVTLNQSAFIPPQCYANTIDDKGNVSNPCYVCHVSSRPPNFINDSDIQLEFAFVPRARKNAWKNLARDWTARIATVSDAEALAYVRTDNYFDPAGGIIPARRVATPPEEWDHEGDGKWGGFVPDARFEFDERGYDRLPEGGYTGWRAFAYYPLPGAFFPTNGSLGDVMIRLPEMFRQTEAGTLSLAVYEANLAVIEALVTRADVTIPPISEAEVSFDLDQSGALGRATRVVYAPPGDRGPRMSYVGRAKAALAAGTVHLNEGLYPEGVEFLHTLRYLDPTPTGVRMSARLKELRYAKKTEWFSVAQLDKRAKVEAISKEDSPTELRNFGGDIERGASNNQGWTFHAFIEDAKGDLRPQTFEEQVYCIGCHGGVGATDDGIFSYGRKLGHWAFQGGYYHPSQRGLEGVPDRPIHGGSSTEYVTYLELNRAGDEFRRNEEVRARFFDADEKLVPSMKAKLRADISTLIMPSPERAQLLNKAYMMLVREQSFQHGRELVPNGAPHVHRVVERDQKTGITTPVEPPWSKTRILARVD